VGTGTVFGLIRAGFDTGIQMKDHLMRAAFWGSITFKRHLGLRLFGTGVEIEIEEVVDFTGLGSKSGHRDSHRPDKDIGYPAVIRAYPLLSILELVER
jgi:hypothetical protein